MFKKLSRCGRSKNSQTELLEMKMTMSELRNTLVGLMITYTLQKKRLMNLKAGNRNYPQLIDPCTLIRSGKGMEGPREKNFHEGRKRQN